MGKCEICSVTFPEGEEARELHETGKRHIRARAQRETLLSLADRSIFIKCTAGVLSRDVLTKAASQFGAVDRVLFRENASFAIVEFKEDSSVDSALKQGQTDCDGVHLTFSKRKMNFSSEPEQEKRSIKIDEVCSTSRLCSGFVAQIDSVVESIAISPQEMSFRESFATRLEVELSRFFLHPRVTIFGSSVTSIGTKDSDIDACLDLLPDESSANIPELNRDKFTLLTCDISIIRGRKVSAAELLRLSAADRARFLCKVLNEIRKESGWIGHQRPVLDARCPVVRFIADKQILIDLSIDNKLGCAKSNYLKMLLLRDKSANLRRVLLGFRFWAMSNQLFEPLPNQHKGHFNAYMLNLLVTAYMRSVNIIPAFSYSKQEQRANGWRIDFEIPDFDLGSLDISSFFKDFFIFVVSNNFNDRVITFDQRSVSTEEFSRENEELLKHFKLAHINIQDPLEHTHNVCQNICEKSLALMRRQMMFSLAKMKKNKDSFIDLCCLSSSDVSSDGRPSSSNDDVTAGGVFEVSPTRSISRLAGLPSQITATSAKSVISTLLEEVVGFEADSQPTNKRARTDGTEPDGICPIGTFSVRHKLWVGRRNIRRKLAAASSSLEELALEREVSRSILSNNAVAKPDIIGRLRVSVAIDRQSALCVLFDRIEGDPAEITNLAHFLEQLLEKNRNLVISQMEKEVEPEQMET